MGYVLFLVIFFNASFNNKTFDSWEAQKIKTSGLQCPYVLAWQGLELTADDHTLINNATNALIILLVFLVMFNTKESLNTEMVYFLWVLAKLG